MSTLDICLLPAFGRPAAQLQVADALFLPRLSLSSSAWHEGPISTISTAQHVPYFLTAPDTAHLRAHDPSFLTSPRSLTTQSQTRTRDLLDEHGDRACPNGSLQVPSYPTSGNLGPRSIRWKLEAEHLIHLKLGILGSYAVCTAFV
ncbi:hypothetical protein EIP91_008051 [Steccherinum ochraceum]|uniref:Uncharacterized protein n=1 Tax=Steccherinum ochraceum TaxID=92696 RepID=A0A4R0RNP3_9APHY|nr:hypothetical protein EIP91_008051 [Steccherinum ochraceum]